MSTKVIVPTLGESVTSASIAAWRVKVGEAVAVDDILVDLETEKVGMEVPSPVAGVVESISAAEGDEVEIGALLCSIAEGEVANPKTNETKTEMKPADLKTSQIGVQAETTPASPSAIKMAKEKGIDIASTPASGPKGHVLKEDIAKAASAPPPKASPAASSPAQIHPSLPQYEHIGERPIDQRGEERVRMSKLRKVIATRLKQAQNQAALLTTFNEVDMTAMLEVRKEYREKFEKKHNAKLGFMSFFVKATVYALQELPAVNAEIYGDEIIYKNYYDIGIAIGSPQGLVVPILRDADKTSFADIENIIADFARRAREGTLTIGEMHGGTFTITNGGVYGSLLSTPIINPPQSGILGMHKIQNRPICRGDEIVIAPMMYLAHSYDHRIIDGREAVTFLVRIKELLEDPARLLLNV